MMKLWATILHAPGLLGGMTRAEAMKQKMLFYQDYYTVLGPETAKEVCYLPPHHYLKTCKCG